MRWRASAPALPQAHPPDYAWKMSPHSNSNKKENTWGTVSGNEFVLPQRDKCKEDWFTITRPLPQVQYLNFRTLKGCSFNGLWTMLWCNSGMQLWPPLGRPSSVSLYLTCANSGFSGTNWHNCSTLGWWLLLLNSALKACPIELLAFHSPIKFWAARESFSCLKNVLFLWNFAF